MCADFRWRYFCTPAIFLFNTILALLSTGYAAEKPRIRILATGGTIAGLEVRQEAGSYRSGVLPASALIAAIPDVVKLAEVSTEQVCNIGSQSMTNAIWLQLANRLNAALQSPEVDGVIVTHGTDTMEETAYFLSLVARSQKPIVMTGAMRPVGVLSPDGPGNLFDAIMVATSPEARGRGVLVVASDEIHYAREIEKTNTIGLNNFQSPHRGLAGVIDHGKPIFYSRPILKYGETSEFSIDGLQELPSVEIVYSYANFGRGTIDYLVGQGIQGIVLAGVGDGNATDAALGGLKDAVRRGVVVVRSTRVANGITRRNIEVDDDHNGFIASEELNPQKARVLLMLGLTKTSDKQKLQRYFLEY